jgi:histidinol-phosphate aminotransferase
MTDPFTLAQPQICDLAPYQPGMPIETLARKFGLDPASIIKLASNENPDGMSPKAKAAATSAMQDASRYPDGYALRQALAAKFAVASNQIVLGNGSNDLLDLIARVFLGKGAQAVSSQYAFGVYQLITKITSAENVVVQARKFGHDLAAMRRAISEKTRIVWIANPNNPTGTLLGAAELETFIADVPEHVVVVLDEAYSEYLKESDRADSVAWLEKYPQLILVRTFSKAYGLAGLRVGYAFASPAIADLMNRVRQPFNVTHVSITAAVAALADDEFVAQSRERNRKGLRQLRDGLDKLGLPALPAYGNFITVKFPDADEVNEQLLRQGVIVRPIKEYGMVDYLRITVGTTDENARLLVALGTIIKKY